MYKTLTEIIARRVLSHLEDHSLLPAEQKGNHSGSRGCKDQLLISKAIFEDSKKRKKNLSIAWIMIDLIIIRKHLIVYHIAG
jgi:hypothetical protein